MKLNLLFVVVACLVLASGCKGPSKESPEQTSQIKQLQDQVVLLQTEKQALENKLKTNEQLTSQVKQLQDQVVLLQTEKKALEDKSKTPSNLPIGTNQDVTLNSDQEKLSYAIGCQIGTSLKAQETALELPLLTQGLTQVLNGQTPALSEDQVRQTIMAWQKEVQARMEQKRKELGEKNLAEGKAFLEANAKKEGVKALASGLQYKVLTDGAGKIPVSTDKVKVNYRGTLTNGTEFDSSYKRNQPAEFPVTNVIKGWVEALQLMKEGSKWELYIPATLAYGESGRPNIPPNSVLVFEVELLEIVKTDPNAVAAPAIRPPAPTPSAKPAPAPGATPAPAQATKPQ